MTTSLVSRATSVDCGGRRILHAVDATVCAGIVTAVVGPNGSGKSTLLRTLAGLWRPSAGAVELDGRPVRAIERREFSRQVAFLPQDAHCEFAFTVLEFVQMGRYPHRGRFERAGARDVRAVDAALAICDLGALWDRTVDRLSGGERQRVAIARCLATEPSFILLDEPTAHVDLAHGLAVLDLCVTLARAGRGVVVATHDLAMVAQHADRVLVLAQGRVVADGPPREVLTRELCEAVFAVDMHAVPVEDGGVAYAFRRTARRTDAG